MPVAEEDKHKTAFRCHLGHYAFNKVPFGLKSAPNFFQREMNKILADLIGKCVFVYYWIFWYIAKLNTII